MVHSFKVDIFSSITAKEYEEKNFKNMNIDDILNGVQTTGSIPNYIGGYVDKKITVDREILTLSYFFLTSEDNGDKEMSRDELVKYFIKQFNSIDNFVDTVEQNYIDSGKDETNIREPYTVVLTLDGKVYRSFSSNSTKVDYNKHTRVMQHSICIEAISYKEHGIRNKKLVSVYNTFWSSSVNHMTLFKEYINRDRSFIDNFVKLAKESANDIDLININIDNKRLLYYEKKNVDSGISINMC